MDPVIISITNWQYFEIIKSSDSAVKRAYPPNIVQPTRRPIIMDVALDGLWEKTVFALLQYAAHGIKPDLVWSTITVIPTLLPPVILQRN